MIDIIHQVRLLKAIFLSIYNYHFAPFLFRINFVRLKIGQNEGRMTETTIKATYPVFHSRKIKVMYYSNQAIVTDRLKKRTNIRNKLFLNKHRTRVIYD